MDATLSQQFKQHNGFIAEFKQRMEDIEENEFIAEFNCTSSVNGVIMVDIINIDEMWDMNEYDTCADQCMELHYRSLPTSKISQSNSSIDQVWRVKDILMCNISYDGTFAIRVPVYLHSYQFEFGLSTRNTKSDSFWPRSESQIVIIPSFLCETNTYSVDDKISFRNMLNCRVSKGEILEELEEGNYRILWIREAKEVVIHCSKICSVGLDNIMMISTLDETDMINDLLIRRRDEESTQIFEAIRNEYNEHSRDACVDIYDRADFMFHWEAMSLFVTKNVFDFLFEPHFEYKIDCLMDARDGFLRMSNLLQKDINQDYEMMRAGVDNAHIEMDSFDRIQYNCDHCRDLLTEWNYSFGCYVKNWDQRHDVCLMCVSETIKLNQKLAALLADILKNNLNMDCVQTIVDYVIERVVKKEFDQGNNKRKQDFDLVGLPTTKRQKLCDCRNVM